MVEREREGEREMRGTPERLITLFPLCGNTARRQPSAGQKALLPETNHAGILITDFQPPEF